VVDMSDSSADVYTLLMLLYSTDAGTKRDTEHNDDNDTTNIESDDDDDTDIEDELDQRSSVETISDDQSPTTPDSKDLIGTALSTLL
jgi:hypothetical protein